MKFLIIGLGSMGKRRIRNLRCLDAGEIIGFDLSEERRKESEKKYKIKTFDRFEDALLANPDAFIISTPPHLHKPYILEAIKHNKHFFTELNLISADLKEVVRKMKHKKIVASSSTTMRYIDCIKKIKEIIDDKKIGNLASIIYHVGQYLTDWHPWEDYRNFFASRKDTSACKEILAIELNWLTWMFGNVKSVSCMKGKFSNLDLEIEDTYHVIINFNDAALASISVDAVSRTPFRELKIIGDKGTVLWDKNGNSVRVYTSDDKKWRFYKEEKGSVEKGYVHKEEPYIQEMADFIKAIKKRKDYFSVKEELGNLRLLDCIEESCEKNEQINIR